MKYVIYHAGCMDGFCSAWLMNKVLDIPAENLISAKYGDPWPNIPASPENTVYVVDFSFPPHILESIAGLYGRIVVIDHHESAIKQFDRWDKPSNVEMNLDVNYSGAMLTWRYLNTLGTNLQSLYERLEIVKYVQDYDLWQFQLLHSHEINAYLQTLSMTLPGSLLVWDYLIGIPTSTMILLGGTVIRLREQVIRRQAAAATLQVDEGLISYISVNATAFPNELAEYLLEKYPVAKYADIWHVRANGDVKHSLRGHPSDGADDVVNVADIAATYGGGGHPTSASYVIPMSWPRVIAGMTQTLDTLDSLGE